MAWWDRMAGQRLAIAGVEQEPRSNLWNFVSGVTAVYNAATKAWDLTVAGGGGGSAHTVQEEGVSLTQRAALNFVGPNITAADVGGKTQISVPAINLGGAGVTGTLPITSVASGFVKADGTVAMTGDINLGTHKITGLVAGSASGHGVEYDQMNAAIAAAISSIADWKQSVRAATTANITLSGAQTIDGVSVIAGDRVLVKNQSTGSQNGIYVAAAGAWARATDADTSAEVTSGMACVVEEGTASAGKVYLLATSGAIVLGTTALAFTALSGTAVTAGNGLTGTSTLSVLAEDATITVGAGGIKRPAITGDATIAAGSNASVITALALSKLATQAALSVVANPTNATAVPTAVAAASDGQVFCRSGTSLLFTTIATAGITDGAVTYAKIQNVSAASRVLLRGSAGGAGSVQEGTCSVGIRVNGTAIELSAALAPMATLGTALQQLRVNAGATALEYFSPPSPVDGGNLTNASVTKNITDGSQYTVPAGTLSASTKTLTLGTSGTPEDGEIIEVIVYAQSVDFILKDGGSIGDNFYTVSATTKRVLHAQWNQSAGAWRPAGKIRLT